MQTPQQHPTIPRTTLDMTNHPQVHATLRVSRPTSLASPAISGNLLNHVFSGRLEVALALAQRYSTVR